MKELGEIQARGAANLARAREQGLASALRYLGRMAVGETLIVSRHEREEFEEAASRLAATGAAFTFAPYDNGLPDPSWIVTSTAAGGESAAEKKEG
ncbi:MAG TPA: hypothetical protein VGB70_12955 [Allosphingosinicella sp.]